MDLQSTVVMNEAHFSESVHEKTDARPGCTYHLCKGLLTDLGNYGLGHAFLAEMRKQEQNRWRTLPARYDDGGYSGGTMERPGLRQLLEDVRDNKVNVVVVYKVDRLTRSLSDFAKIVEALDTKGTCDYKGIEPIFPLSL